MFGTYWASSSPILKTPLELLKDNAALGSDAVCEYCQYLSVNQQFSYLKDLLYTNITVPQLASKIKEKKGPVHIPMKLKKCYDFTRDHLVVFTLDRDARTVEYYDSRGKSLDDEARSVIGVNLPVYQFFHELTEELDKREKTTDESDWEIISDKVWKITSNPFWHQLDFHNCGVYVCWYLEARQQGKTFQQITASNVNPSRFRNQMIRQLENFDSSSMVDSFISYLDS